MLPTSALLDDPTFTASGQFFLHKSTSIGSGIWFGDSTVMDDSTLVRAGPPYVELTAHSRIGELGDQFSAGPILLWRSHKRSRIEVCKISRVLCDILTRLVLYMSNALRNVLTISSGRQIYE